jgi:signal transduction histidine kinase
MTAHSARSNTAPSPTSLPASLHRGHDVTERNETERSFSQLSLRLLELQEEERRRIARELHDTTGQQLAALRLNLSRILRTPQQPPELVEETFALIDRAASEIRTLSYLLHPPMIEQAGLVATLRWYVRGFEGA